MTETEWADHDDMSLLAFGTTLLQNRWRIARWALFGALLGALLMFLKPPLYMASASFVPQGQGNDAGRSGIASIAGQFGLAINPVNQATSPEFYSSLTKSRVLLNKIASDTLIVPEMGGRRVAVLDLLDIPAGTTKLREEKATKRLREIVESSVVKTTGVVQLSVSTKWPSVSLAIARAIVSGVNDYNQRTRQGQAAAERKFLEARVAVANSDLRQVEDQLEQFLRANRSFRTSPDLTAQYDRIQREVTLKQQVFTSLTQAYEEARMREVRDTPVITVIEPPEVPSVPEPSGRVKGILFGLLLGAICAILFVFGSEGLARRRDAGDAEAVRFAQTVQEVRSGLVGRLGWFNRHRP